MSELTFDEYQRQTIETAVYPREAGVIYPLLGLVGEIGEVCGKVYTAIEALGIDDQNANTPIEILDILEDMATLGVQAEGLKKLIRDKGILSETDKAWAEKARQVLGEPDIKAPLIKELGDVYWYQAALGKDLGVSMSEIAAGNLAKLAARKAKGTLQGSGDNR